MMKKVLVGGLLVAIGLFFTFAVSKEESNRLDTNERYKVIHVNGRILFKKTGKDMARGDYYIPGNILEFTSNESRAAVIHKSKGRFVLTGNSKGKVKVLPAANNISSRGGALLNFVDLKNYFDGKRMFFDKSKVQVGTESFPMNNEKYFYLKFKHGDEEIAKKLDFNGDIVFFEKAQIFKVDREQIPYEEKEMTLYYRTSGKSKKINTFTPVFPNKLDLEAEVSLILEELDDESVGKKQDEIAAHLNEFYGKVELIELNAWLADEFDVK